MRPAKSDANSNRRGVQTAADVRWVLATELESVTANPDLDPLRKAQVVAQLAREVLHAIELANLQARVEALEAALKVRSNPSIKETRT
jgi:DnaJ-domain-containing protein 1